MAVNIADLFEHAVDAFPERVAIACGDRQVNFTELERDANRLAHYLARQGIGPGAHVGVYARNSIEAIETMIAAYKLRAVPINVNYRYVENELRYLFDNADLVALVHDATFADRVAAVRPDAPKLTTVLVTEELESLSVNESAERDFGARSPDDLYVLYTGGTTGNPKGVMWRHEDVWRVLGGGIDFVTGEPLPDEFAQSQRGKQAPTGLTRLACAPLIHGAAQWAALPALFAGDLVVIMPRFDPHEVWKAVARHQVRVITITGDAMARPLIEAYRAGGYDASSVVAISSHAALFSPSVKEEYLEALPNVVITDAIGSSESGFNGLGMVVKGSRPNRDGPRVNRGPSTIVIDDDNRPITAGVGRIARGGHVPLGYYKDPAKTASIFVEVDGKRYVVPGDYGRLEEDGTLTLLGRGNMSVNTGGEKVFPEEVEGALKSHPDVFDALVVGVADERLGQRVAALVQPRDGRTIDHDELDAHIRKEIAGYKTPRSVWIVDEVGRSPSGKPDYRWARAYTEEHEPSWHNELSHAHGTL